MIKVVDYGVGNIQAFMNLLKIMKIFFKLKSMAKFIMYALIINHLNRLKRRL